MNQPFNPFGTPPGAPPYPQAPQAPQAAPQSPPGFPGLPTMPPAQGAPYGAPPMAPQMPPAPHGYGAPPAGAPITSAMPGTFSGIESVSPAMGGYPFFPDGVHRCENVKVRFLSTNGDQYYIVDARIMETNSPETSVGSMHTYMEKLNTKYRESAMKTIKAHLAGSLGIDAEDSARLSQINDAFVAHVVSEQNPLAGRPFEVRVSTVPQKGDPSKTYTKHYFGIPGTEPLPAAPAQAQAPQMPTAAPQMPPQGFPGLPPMQTPQPAPTFPPAGWQAHPQNPAYFWKPGTSMPAVSESDLRLMMERGQA